MIDAKYKIVKTNKNFLRIVQARNEEEFNGTDIKSLFKAIDFEHLVLSRQHQMSINEVILECKGNTVRLNLQIFSIYNDVHFDGFIILCRDIKEIIRLSQRFKDRPLIEFDNIVTQDSAMEKLIQTCRKIALLDITVLLEGESGTGKELFAQSIHNGSSRRDKPFIAVNCAALPVNLVESELFGYEKGAFTGAMSTGSVGKFEQAEGGTIFLDEVGELPLDIQAKLLRILDNKKLTRVGGSKEKVLDIRVITATNRDLLHEIKLKNFREDLYYRLNVVNFRLPSLNERGKDIPLLTNYFLDKLNRENKTSKRLAESVMKIINNRHWKGNIRELQNAIIRAYYICDGQTITTEHLPDYKEGEEHSPPIQIAQRTHLESNVPINNYSVKDSERNLIVNALNEYNGKIKDAAIQLGIPPSTLYKKLKHYDITIINKSYH